jgi:hypothetical protein
VKNDPEFSGVEIVMPEETSGNPPPEQMIAWEVVNVDRRGRTERLHTPTGWLYRTIRES